jgi:hypothetical protein
METMKRPNPRTTRSPKRSTNFPEKSPETKRMIAKEEMINPIRVFETPKVLAKIGMAGIIRPNPTATRNEIAVSTETSFGSPLKGELMRMFIPAPLQQHPAAHWHGRRYLAVASLPMR